MILNNNFLIDAVNGYKRIQSLTAQMIGIEPFVFDWTAHMGSQVGAQEIKFDVSDPLQALPSIAGKTLIFVDGVRYAGSSSSLRTTYIPLGHIRENPAHVGNGDYSCRFNPATHSSQAHQRIEQIIAPNLIMRIPAGLLWLHLHIQGVIMTFDSVINSSIGFTPQLDISTEIPADPVFTRNLIGYTYDGLPRLAYTK